MPILNDIFSSDDNDSNSSNETTGMLDSTLGLDANNSSESYSRDEDGNESYDSSDTGVGLDTSTDGLLDTMSETMNRSDDTEVGG